MLKLAEKLSPHFVFPMQISSKISHSFQASIILGFALRSWKFWFCLIWRHCICFRWSRAETSRKIVALDLPLKFPSNFHCHGLFFVSESDLFCFGDFSFAIPRVVLELVESCHFSILFQLPFKLPYSWFIPRFESYLSTFEDVSFAAAIDVLKLVEGLLFSFLSQVSIKFPSPWFILCFESYLSAFGNILVLWVH